MLPAPWPPAGARRSPGESRPAMGNNQGEWVTIKQAATAAGVDERTIRRWVASGKVVSELSDGDHPPVRLVRRDSLPLRHKGAGAVVTPDHPGSYAPDHPGDQGDRQMATVPAVVTLSLAPADAEALTAIRVASERQAAAAEAQAEELAGLRAELAALRELLAPKPRPWWRFWRR